MPFANFCFGSNLISVPAQGVRVSIHIPLSLPLLIDSLLSTYLLSDFGVAVDFWFEGAEGIDSLSISLRKKLGLGILIVECDSVWALEFSDCGV